MQIGSKNVIWKPHPGSQELFMSCPADEALLHGNRGGGKGLLPEEKVLTPRGWTTMGELRPGSVISNPDGTSQTVIQVFAREEQQMYRLRFSDGAVIDCDADHLWFAKVANRIKGKTVRNYTPLNFYGSIFRTEDLYKTLQVYPHKRPLIPCCEPIKYQKLFKGEVDAYLIGLILGDGCIDKVIRVTTLDQEIVDYCVSKGARYHSSDSRTPSCHFNKRSQIMGQIVELGLHGTKAGTKFVPERLLRGTVAERKAVLQGLMDTDGECHDGKAYFSSISEQLIDDVRQLVLSLGGWATKTGGKELKYRKKEWETGVYKNTGSIGWGLYIRFPEQKELFRLTRKREQATNYMHGRLVRTIISIEKRKRKRKTICILVNNPNRLFITKDFIVTHNTDSLLMDFLQHVGCGYRESWRGILFREEYTELTDIIAKSQKWIKQIFPGAKYNATDHKWTFEDGEALFLRYMRLPSDYYNYHGHEYSIYANSFIRTPKGYTRACDVRVGDYVDTLQGPSVVDKVLRYNKPGVKLSVYDDRSCLVGSQLQGIVHPVLTSAGWQRLGLSCLSQTSEQPLFESPLTREVFQFLHGVHQEILHSYVLSLSDPVGSSIEALHQVQFSVLFQILEQLPWKTPQLSSFFESLLETDLDTLLASSLEEIGQVTYGPTWVQSPHSVQLLVLYCVFLIALLLRVRQSGLYLLLSTLSCVAGLSFSQVTKISRVTQPLLGGKLNGQMQLFLYAQLYLLQNEVRATYSSVLLEMHRVLNCQDGYSVYLHQYDGQLPHGSAPSQVGSPSPFGVLRPSTGVYYQPYSFGSLQRPMPLDSGLRSSSFSVVPFGQIPMVDFQVRNARHYISALTSSIAGDDTIVNTKNDNATKHTMGTSDVRHGMSNTICVVNQNCFLGWEELTNWATDECFKAMFSCNRSSHKDIPKKVRATCNPSGPGHAWTKSYFIDVAPALTMYTDPETNRSRVHIPSRLEENKTLLEADPNYSSTILAAVKDDPVRYKAWVLGEWDIVVGGALSNVWDSAKQVFKPVPFPSSWKVYRSFDWGSAKPWCVTYGAEANGEQFDPDYNMPFIPKDSLILIDEIYGWDGTPDKGDFATSSEIAKRVLAKDAAIAREFGCKVIAGPADTAIYEVRDGTSIGQNMASFGLHWKRAYKGSGSRVAGLAMIRQMLAASKNRDLEKPWLVFYDRARHHIRTFPLLQYDSKNQEDVDSGSEDHCYDSVRYLSTRKYTRLKHKKVGY